MNSDEIDVKIENYICFSKCLETYTYAVKSVMKIIIIHEDAYNV